MSSLPILKSLSLALGGTSALAGLLYAATNRRVLKSVTSQSSEALKVVPGAHGDGSTVIVISGWGGALPKHLTRLQEMYRSRGYATVVVLPSMLPFLENATCVGVGAELLLVLRKHLQNLPADTKPRVFIHTHSNTSTFYYYSVMRCMQYAVFSPVAEAYCGTIYDSNPGHPGVYNIKPPKGFGDALAEYYRRSPAAEEPLTFSDGSFNPLPIKEGHWAGDAFTRNRHPLSWALAAAVMSMVSTPIIIKRNQYVHPFWTPACFVVCFVEYARTTARELLTRISGVFSDTKNAIPLTTRFGKLLSPHSMASMEEAAKLIAASGLDGFGKEDERLAFERLVTLHNFCSIQNFDIRNPMPAPELFIYSKTDALVPAKDVERYIYARSTSQYEASVPFVHAHRFEKSPHVAHFLKAPEVYARVCDNFIASAVKHKEAAEAKGAKSPFPTKWFGKDQRQN